MNARLFRFGSLLLLVPWNGLAAETPPETAAETGVVVVTGAPGESRFADEFETQAKDWIEAATKSGVRVTRIGTGQGGDPAATPDRERLRMALQAAAKAGERPLWLILIGHGTFDGAQARFNLRGPDVSGAELASWLKAFQRPLVIVNTTSSSAPFLAALSGPQRIVVTATRSGFEQSYARFGQFLSAAIKDGAGDLDKDGQVSLLEAFLVAARQTGEFYKTDGRLATEHPLIDDNGDGMGTPADWFKGVRATKSARDGAALDGSRARQVTLVPSAAEHALGHELRARRDELERQVETLRNAKQSIPEQEYFARLESLLVELASVYERGNGESESERGGESQRGERNAGAER